jgi:pyruvate-ferredoxin/flavodoxin oxidoreductase
MQRGMKQQDLAVACGYWPLFRYNPALREVGENPFVLDSPRPTLKFRDYAYNEARYRALAQSRPEEAAILLAQAQAALEEKYRSYEEIAGWSATRFHPAGLRNSGIAGRVGERVDEDAA